MSPNRLDVTNEKSAARAPPTDPVAWISHGVSHRRSASPVEIAGHIASRGVLHSRIATIVKLQNPIRPYAWGSHHSIAELQGRLAPTAEPEAELWIGDHPKAPSSALIGDCPVKLPDWISADPDAVLGPQVRRRYGDSLPFLVKLLAAAQPLSIQVHPNPEQAREGYAREQRQGVPVDSPRRSYCDPNGKRELLIALTRFSALCGFRSDSEVEQLLVLRAGPQVVELLTELRRREY